MQDVEPGIRSEYFLGLDLGQAQDFTALAALERRPVLVTPRDPDEPRPADHYCYTLRGLRRWPLGTLYTQIVQDVAAVVRREPLAGCTLGVDKTGCGSPVVELLRAAGIQADLRPVLITAGFAVTPDDGGFHVPKRELVSCLQLLLQSRSLEIPATIPEAAALEKELLAFRAKITAAKNEVFEVDWRQAPHDDMVLALAIAAWLGERVLPYEAPSWIDVNEDGPPPQAHNARSPYGRRR